MAKKKKKQEQGGGGSPAWMATFSDLMNLLLCFFVLLFSMSSVDAEKYEALLASLTGNFSVFKSGSSMVGESIYVASGANQMVQISDYFTEFTSDGGKEGMEQFQGESTSEGDKNGQGAQTEQNQGAPNTIQSEEQYEALMKEQLEQEASALYEQVSDITEDAKLDGTVIVEKDKYNQYVKISIGGAILFDSGKAELKPEAKKVLSKVGDILKMYENHLIKIEGHTDNVVPTSGSVYKNNMMLSMARAESVFEFMQKKKKMNPAILEASGRGEYVPVASNKTADGRAKNRRVEFKIYTEEIEE